MCGEQHKHRDNQDHNTDRYHRTHKPDKSHKTLTEDREKSRKEAFTLILYRNMSVIRRRSLEYCTPYGIDIHRLPAHLKNLPWRNGCRNSHPCNKINHDPQQQIVRGKYHTQEQKQAHDNRIPSQISRQAAYDASENLVLHIAEQTLATRQIYGYERLVISRRRWRRHRTFTRSVLFRICTIR